MTVTLDSASSSPTPVPPPPPPPGRLAIARLQDEGASPQAIDAFLREHSFPLVEGPSVTFVWRGHADAVSVRHWIFGLASSQNMARLPGSDLWAITLELPPGSRVEYKIELSRGDHRELVQDPLNPNLARDPFGANSVVHAQGYATPEWIRPDPESRPGELHPLSLHSPIFGGERHFTLYLPARFRRTRRYPLLVVHDGGDYINFTSMKTILDNLIHRLEVAELIVCFQHPYDRLREYANDERHARHLTEELIPWIEARYPCLGRPQGRGLAGASFGAVASFSTAWRNPSTFGRLLLQSGSFAFTDIGRRNHRGPLFDPVVEFVNAYRAQPTFVAERVFVSCGMYESLIYENRSLYPLLQSTAMDVRFVEARDGHNWENWRDRLREGLSWLFPGPLLMVYE